MLIAYELSEALREKSQERLTKAFAEVVRVESAAGNIDSRDTMVGLAPFLDCARRLGHDPEVLLGPIAKAGAEWFQQLFEGFVRRSDVTLGNFGWSLAMDPDGPRYFCTVGIPGWIARSVE
jgi:hypothetical protein